MVITWVLLFSYIFYIKFLLLHNVLPQTQQLKKTHIHYVAVSVSQESGHSLTIAPAQHLTSLQSRCQLAVFQSGDLIKEEHYFQIHSVVGRIYLSDFGGPRILISYWPSSGGCPQALAATYSSPPCSPLHKHSQYRRLLLHGGEYFPLIC